MTIFELTKEECRLLVWEDLETDQFQIVEDEDVGYSRWSIKRLLTVLDRESQKYYQTYYQVGATESQDEVAFEYTDPDWVEVEKIPVTTFVFKPVKPVVSNDFEDSI